LSFFYCRWSFERLEPFRAILDPFGDKITNFEAKQTGKMLLKNPAEVFRGGCGSILASNEVYHRH